MTGVLVAGAGKLGAVLAAVLADAGHVVAAVDRDPSVVGKLNYRVAPVDEPGLQRLLESLPDGRLSATIDYSAAVAATDVAMIVVPTPTHPKSGEFDPAYVRSAAIEIAAALRDEPEPRPYTIVVCSTVMPGHMDQVIAPAIREHCPSGWRPALAYNPLFIALGSVLENMTNPDMVLIGANDHGVAAVVAELSSTYQGRAPIHVMNCREAELAKLSLNCALSVKVALTNTVAAVARHIDADPDIILKAVGADSRIGPKLLRPGAPAGGVCLPRDLRALDAFAERNELDIPLIPGTIEANRAVIIDLIVQICDAHDTNPGPVAILGLSYKPGAAVTDDSLGFHLVEALTESMELRVHDPKARLDGTVHFDTVDEAIAGANVVVIACPHPEYARDIYGDRIVVDPWRHVQRSSSR